jgi:hypothetical protein
LYQAFNLANEKQADAAPVQWAVMPPIKMNHSTCAGDFIKLRYHDLNSFGQRSGITLELTDAPRMAFDLRKGIIIKRLLSARRVEWVVMLPCCKYLSTLIGIS